MWVIEIARRLGLPLDVIIPRKIGAPDNVELAIGAMTEDGTIIFDDHLVSYLGFQENMLGIESVSGRKVKLSGDSKCTGELRLIPTLKGQDVIIVDDGIATGSTMKAALASVKNKGAEQSQLQFP